jgi:hypothetical protein
MNGVDVTRETLALVHQYIEAAFEGCEGETLTRTFPGSTVGSIGSIYLHALATEDWAIQQLIQGKPKLIDITGDDWYARLGVEKSADVDWSKANMNLSAIKDYAAAVYGATDAWLASATDADLSKEIPWGSRATHSVAWVLADTIQAHLGFHAGEIGALKGIMGLKGLPW